MKSMIKYGWKSVIEVFPFSFLTFNLNGGTRDNSTHEKVSTFDGHDFPAENVHGC
jgi:hypothetical protein